MVKNKRKVKKNNILLFVILLVCIFLGIYLIFFKNKTGEIPEVEIIDSIDNFNYSLSDNKTKYYNKLFDELKSLLGNSDYDESEYAILVSKLFLADFYDLDSKVMKNDIGGSQFVYESYRNDFELGAMNSVYKYIESNVYGDRKQDLPVVEEVSLVDFSNSTFNYGELVDENAYFLNMNIDYSKDLNYPTSVMVVLIHSNDKLEIAQLVNN